MNRPRAGQHSTAGVHHLLQHGAYDAEGWWRPAVSIGPMRPHAGGGGALTGSDSGGLWLGPSLIGGWDYLPAPDQRWTLRSGLRWVPAVAVGAIFGEPRDKDVHDLVPRLDFELISVRFRI